MEKVLQFEKSNIAEGNAIALCVSRKIKATNSKDFILKKIIFDKGFENRGSMRLIINNKSKYPLIIWDNPFGNGKNEIIINKSLNFKGNLNKLSIESEFEYKVKLVLDY